MNAITIPSVGSRQVNYRAGEMRSDVSNQWFNRPDDQKFLTLDKLRQHTQARYDASRADTIQNRELEFFAPEVNEISDTHQLSVGFPDGGEAQFTNWAFSQVCELSKAPTSYLKTLPSQLVADNLTWGMRHNRAPEEIKTYRQIGDESQLLAVTGPKYGRIGDYEVVEAVQQIAGTGLGENGWKVPGVMDWYEGTYNPYVDVTKETTTLFASDRDVFIFLVDDTHPIEVGKLPDGSPDLMFRGFYVWNSEVGSKTMGIAVMYLRGVCMNRCLWGVEGFNELSIRHSNNAPARFVHEASPALVQFANGRTNKLIEGVANAKAAKVADDQEDAMDFLRKRGFSKSRTAEILTAVEEEEQHPARSIWDMSQGITAVARKIPHQDARLTMEREAKKMLDKVLVAA